MAIGKTIYGHCVYQHYSDMGRNSIYLGRYVPTFWVDLLSPQYITQEIRSAKHLSWLSSTPTCFSTDLSSTGSHFKKDVQANMPIMMKRLKY